MINLKTARVMMVLCTLKVNPEFYFQLLPGTQKVLVEERLFDPDKKKLTFRGKSYMNFLINNPHHVSFKTSSVRKSLKLQGEDQCKTIA